MNNATEKPVVLVVDDDARNVFALTAVLRARGFACISATNAPDALLMLDTHRPAVLLLDMMMPDMDGYEAIAHIRANPNHAGLPVIAVTAQAMLGDKEKCLAAGADGYVSKPVNIDELTALMEQYL